MSIRDHTPGPWTTFRMTVDDDLPTPEQIGEYVKNSVIKSAERSGTTDFLFVSCVKEDGESDVCHVGNGPTSPANAQLIAASPDLWELAISFCAAETPGEFDRVQREAHALVNRLGSETAEAPA